jgi:Cation transporter/ATPase, N-terminus
LIFAFFWPILWQPSIMGDEKLDPELSEKQDLSAVTSATENPETIGVTQPSNLRIQFTPAARPDRTKLDEKDEITRAPTGGENARRPSLPPILSQKERARREREAEVEKKNVNVDEHLMSIQDVAARYNTSINLEKPGSSLGLTTAEAEQVLKANGLNVLTPPKKRHPFLKYLGKSSQALMIMD